MVSVAVQNVVHILATNEVTIRDGHGSMEEYELAAGTKLSEFNAGFPRGWARRPAHGEQYGKSFLGPYKADIKKFFDRGEENSSAKMNASMMHNELMTMYSGRYTLPAESEIRNEISRLVSVSGLNRDQLGSSTASSLKSFSKSPPRNPRPFCGAQSKYSAR